MSCDHHDEGGCVPDNRSRARMLEQLQAATELSDALARLFQDSRVGDEMARGSRSRDPFVRVPLSSATTVMQAWLAWLQVQPMGDDWAPPVDPPSTTRIPDLPDD